MAFFCVSINASEVRDILLVQQRTVKECSECSVWLQDKNKESFTEIHLFISQITPTVVIWINYIPKIYS